MIRRFGRRVAVFAATILQTSLSLSSSSSIVIIIERNDVDSVSIVTELTRRSTANRERSADVVHRQGYDGSIQ
jgi:hypothetical protein